MMCSGAMLKLQCQESEGVVAFWKLARERLERVADARRELWGVKTRKTLKGFTSFFAPIDKRGVLPELGKKVPFIKLPM